MGRPVTEEDRCVMCGAYVPEGSQVCAECLKNPIRVMDSVTKDKPYKLTPFQKIKVRLSGKLAERLHFVRR